MIRRLIALFVVIALLSGCASSSARRKSQGQQGSYAGTLVKQYGGPKTRPDAMLVRTIALSYPKAGERFEGPYYHDGDYDPAALRAIDSLFRDRHDGSLFSIDPELIDFLVDIRTRLGLPPTVTFEILSGYRSPQTNASLRIANAQVAKESLHTQGLAVDFRIAGVNGSAIAEIAKTMQRGGVSFYPSDNHVHVDIGNIRTWATR